jgi:hypothetical protein
MSSRTDGLGALRGARNGAVGAPARSLSVVSFYGFLGVLNRVASVREWQPTGAECAHLRTRRPAIDRPLRDNDAIDPLSGRHAITQWIVTPALYSECRAHLTSVRYRPK